MVLTLKSSFEIALIVGLLIACLRQTGKYRLLSWVMGGVGAAALLGGFLAYNMNTLGGREFVEGWVMALGFVLTLAFLFWMWAKLSKISSGGENHLSGRPDVNLIAKIFVFLITLILTIIPLVDIALFPTNTFIQTFNVINTELILKFSGGFLGLFLAYLFGVSILQVTRKLPPRGLAIGIAVIVFFLLIKQAVTVTQILLATGILPLTTSALSFLLPLINNLDKYFFALISGAALLVVIAACSIRRNHARPPGRLNPAQQRKIRALTRQQLRWFTTAASLVLLIASLVAVNTVYANKSVELSPATPVTPIEGLIIIPAATVNDRNLHRFAYTVADGTEVRFIIIRKSETAYGVGLDACEICGPVGYYQRKNQVVCRNCDVVMNIPTIGFPGGCNPVPVAYRMEDGNLVLNAADIEKEKVRFKITNVFKN